MDGLPDYIVLSRLQFAITTLFHILWPVLTIGLSLFLVLTETLWLRTAEIAWYHHSRFWSRLLLLNFGVGVVTGLPLEFEFGTNWAPFSRIAGGFFGNLLGFEGAMAFMLEAGFLGIMMFGWDRVPRPIHLLATAMVALGASLSAFWIMDANSWMQTPAGGHLANGQFVLDSYLQAIFNPDMPWGISHMWVACLETSLFVIGGISAWHILKRPRGGVLSQVASACRSGSRSSSRRCRSGSATAAARPCSREQPAKGAAIEGHWDTNPPGSRPPWALIAWPDKVQQRNDCGRSRYPALLSWLATGYPRRTGGRLARLRSAGPAALAAADFLCLPHHGRDRFRAVLPDAVDAAGCAQRPARASRSAVKTLAAARLGGGDPARLYRGRHGLDRARGRAPALGHLRALAHEQRRVGFAGGRASAFTAAGYFLIDALLLVSLWSSPARIVRGGPDFSLPVPQREPRIQLSPEGHRGAASERDEAEGARGTRMSKSNPSLSTSGSSSWSCS